MTYDVYAIYPNGNYLVASGNDADHTNDMAARVLERLKLTPWGVATLTRGRDTLRGPIYSVAELEKECG